MWICADWSVYDGPQVYQAFGLGSSISKVMKFKLLLHYSEILVMNRQLPDVSPQFIDDLFQVTCKHLFKISHTEQKNKTLAWEISCISFHEFVITQILWLKGSKKKNVRLHTGPVTQ